MRAERVPRDEPPFERHGSIGDLLLCSSPGRLSEPARLPGEGWSPVDRHAGWLLAVTPPRPGWSGFPWREIRGDGYRAWLVGELYPLSDDPPLGERIERLLVDGRADRLNGHFLLLVRRDGGAEWYIWTGRYGSLHAYLHHGRSATALGTCFGDVVAVGSERRLDLSALRAFLRYGFFLGTSTHYTDVEILRPAHRYAVEVETRSRHVERYWHWESVERSPCDMPQAVDALAERLRQVIADQVGSVSGSSSVALPLSGGLDSRSLLAALVEIEPPPPEGAIELFSYGYSDDSVETRIARQLGRAAERRVESFTIRPYLLDRASELAARLEGFQDITLARQAAVADELSSPRVLGAHWGDVWLDAAVDPSESRRVDARLADQRLRKRGSGWLEENLLEVDGHEPDPLARLEEEWRPYARLDDRELRLKAFKTDQWSFRWTLTSLRAYQARAYPRLPFYDTRLTDLLLGFPPQLLLDRRLQIEYLKVRAPELARVRWQASGTDLFHLDRARIRRLPKRAVAKLGRAISAKRPLERNWEVQLAGREQRRRLEAMLLRSGHPLHSLYAPRAIGRLVERFYRRWPDPESAHGVTMLLTLAAWLDREQG